MKILYDYQGFMQRVGGVSRYLCELISRLGADNECQICCPITDNVYMRDILHRQSSLGREPFSARVAKAVTIPNKIASFAAVTRGGYDLFHATFDMSYYYKNVVRAPYVLTIHDMIPELIFAKENHGAYRSWTIRRWIEQKRAAALGAARIICVSHYTRQTLLQAIPELNPARVDVVHHGINMHVGGYQSNSYGRYILYVGDRSKPYKNFIFMLNALASLLLDVPDLRLVCTGSALTDSEKAEASKLKIADRVVSAGFVDELMLDALYHHAQLFIYPSLYEGFGMPILEAMSNGCPVCLADATCFPEVGGDAALYFSPHDAEQMCTSVDKIISDNNYAEQMRQAGLKRAAEFSWDKTAELTMKSYQQIFS